MYLFLAFLLFLQLVAELYHLSAYDTVTVTKIDKHHHEEVLKHVSTDFMMVTIKDQFISRGEMFHYLNSLIGKWVFCGERLTSQDVGIRIVSVMFVVLHGFLFYSCNYQICEGVPFNFDLFICKYLIFMLSVLNLFCRVFVQLLKKSGMQIKLSNLG
jgi:hypothetical protein